MNLYKETNAFYDWLETNPLATSGIVLWHALMNIANKAGWPDKFAVAVSVLKVKTGLEKDAICNARNKLQQLGRIQWESRKGNQSAIYKLIPFYSDSVKPTQTAINNNCVVLTATNGNSEPTQTPTQPPPQMATINRLDYIGQKNINSLVPTEVETEKKARRKYIFSQEHMQLAEQLKFRILEHKPNFKYPDSLDQWANTIRLMAEQDRRFLEEIASVIDWCQKDNFWQNNILSADKLREKFDQLQSKMNSASTYVPKKTLTRRTFEDLEKVCDEFDRRNTQKAAKQDDGQLPWTTKH